MMHTFHILIGVIIASIHCINAFIIIGPRRRSDIPIKFPSLQLNSNLDDRTERTSLKQKSSYSDRISSIGSKIHHNLLPWTLALTIILSPFQLEFISNNNSNNIKVDPVPLITAWAADYGSLTVEQKAVAEAWRIVDNNFIDRTFNHQDWFQLRQDFVKKKYKSMDEANTAIESLVSSLGDKYTRYLPLNKYKSIVDAATGTLAGIGVELSTDSTTQRVYVSDVEATGPASIGGIRPGDVFIQVDGVQMNDGKITPDDVAGKLRGPEGSKVGVTIQRNDQIMDFILTREPITITSVKSYISDSMPDVGKVGVVKIKNFSGTTAQVVADAVKDLKSKGATALILDLRGNPGGLLPGGVATASLFLDSNKPVVFVVDKNGVVDSQATLESGIDLDSSLIVFTNGNTASAAEVVTAALKENGRARVVGDSSSQSTFGKGIIQTIRQLSYDNGGLAVTVARYETPLHHDINKQGVPVDYSISACTETDAVKCIPKSAFQKPAS